MAVTLAEMRDADNTSRKFMVELLVISKPTHSPVGKTETIHKSAFWVRDKVNKGRLSILLRESRIDAQLEHQEVQSLVQEGSFIRFKNVQAKAGFPTIEVLEFAVWDFEKLDVLPPPSWAREVGDAVQLETPPNILQSAIKSPQKRSNSLENVSSFGRATQSPTCDARSMANSMTFMGTSMASSRNDEFMGVNLTCFSETEKLSMAMWLSRLKSIPPSERIEAIEKATALVSTFAAKCADKKSP